MAKGNWIKGRRALHAILDHGAEPYVFNPSRGYVLAGARNLLLTLG